MKQSLFATGAAAFIAAGVMVGTIGTASAGIYFGGPHWGVQIGPPSVYVAPPPPQRVCEPVYSTERWIDAWGREHYRTVVVREDCYWTD